MNYNFLATSADKIQILEFIFENTDLQVFDSYSGYSQKICQYGSADEIAAKFDLENGGQFAVGLQLWSPRFGGEVIFRKIALRPEHCDGHTYRYSTNGWGLIQLHLGGRQNNFLFHSNIGHFNERGALGHAEDGKKKEEVSRWRWKEIVSTSERLKRGIHRMAVGKVEGMDILPGAYSLSINGVMMRY